MRRRFPILEWKTTMKSRVLIVIGFVVCALCPFTTVSVAQGNMLLPPFRKLLQIQGPRLFWEMTLTEQANQSLSTMLTKLFCSASRVNSLGSVSIASVGFGTPSRVYWYESFNEWDRFRDERKREFYHECLRQHDVAQKIMEHFHDEIRKWIAEEIVPLDSMVQDMAAASYCEIRQQYQTQLLGSRRLLEQKNWSGALNSFWAMVTIYPLDGPALDGLAQSLAALDKIDLAIRTRIMAEFLVWMQQAFRHSFDTLLATDIGSSDRKDLVLIGEVCLTFFPYDGDIICRLKEVIEPVRLYNLSWRFVCELPCESDVPYLDKETL